MTRYRLCTTSGASGRAIGQTDWPYTSWREAYRAAEDYSARHGRCVVQANRSVGPRGSKMVDTLRVFAYGRMLGGRS